MAVLTKSRLWEALQIHTTSQFLFIFYLNSRQNQQNKNNTENELRKLVVHENLIWHNPSIQHVSFMTNGFYKVDDEAN